MVVAVDVNVVIKVSGAQVDAGAPLQGGEERHGHVGADARQHRHAVVVLHRWIQVVRTVAIQVRRLRPSLLSVYSPGETKGAHLLLSNFTALCFFLFLFFVDFFLSFFA